MHVYYFYKQKNKIMEKIILMLYTFCKYYNNLIIKIIYKNIKK